MTAKYKLGKAEQVEHPLRHAYITVYRVIALVDIPRYGIKAGDIGGYVDHKKVLSQKGDCWVGGDALALDKSKVMANAIVTENAVVSDTTVGGNAQIYGRAKVLEMPGLKKSGVFGSAKIYGDAQVVSSNISDYSQVHEAALLNEARVTGYSDVFGYAKIIGPGALIDNSTIFGYAEIHAHASICDSSIHCQALVHKYGDVTDSVLTHKRVVKEGDDLSKLDMTVLFRRSNGETENCALDGVEMVTCANLYKEKSSLPDAATSENRLAINARQRLDVIEQKYAEYEQDIVKIIKFPIMTDLTNPYTANFHSALRKIQRLYGEGDMTAYKDSLEMLEDTFHIAESNARKISLSQLQSDERAKVADARQMLAIALDEAASETEKKNAFKGAMRNLEGIVAVPETAVATLRQQIGLLEIEA